MSVLTITPNPSTVGDTVAVATVVAETTNGWNSTLTRSNQLDSNIERVYDIAVADNDNVYTGCGYTPAFQDAKVFESTDGGLTFSQKWYHNAYDIISRVITVGNDVHYIGVSDSAGMGASVYKNGVEKQFFTAGAGNTVVFGLVAFANGNIAIGYGDDPSGGRILMSNDGGESYNEVFIGIDSGTSNRITGIAVASDGTTGYAVDTYGYLYRSLDSGATWAYLSTVRTGANNNAIGILPNDDLVSSVFGGSWVTSTDGGLTWVAYTTPPAGTPFAVIKNYDGVTGFASPFGKTYYVTLDGITWQTLSTTDTDIDQFISGGMDESNRTIYMGSGSTAGDGFVYKSLSLDNHLWSLEQDAIEIDSGETLGGAISYDHTAQLTDNNTAWKYIVDGVDSNVVTMLVESGSYYTPVTPYSCTLKLAMEIRKGYANVNSIFDWGSTADTYKTDATYISEGYTIWDRPTANVPEANLNVNGFYPFGNLFASDVAGYRYPVYQGKANFHGAFHSWDVELIPDSSAGYTYDTSPWAARNVTGFSIGALVNFPFPNCTPEAEYSISYNRIGKIVREYDSGEASEHRPFSMQWNNLCGEDLRGILIQLITAVRGNSFTIDTGASLARVGAWLPREGEALSGVFDVRLVSPEINYTCTGSDLWDLEIKVMKWES